MSDATQSPLVPHSHEQSTVPVVPPTKAPKPHNPTKRQIAHGATEIDAPIAPVSEVVPASCDAAISISERALPLSNASETMLRKPPANLFPLLLSPLDSFFCADDSAKFPMSSVIHMDFSGELDESAFRESLEDAIQRHPLLGAHIRIAKRGLPCWVAAKNTEVQIDWQPEGTPIRLHELEAFDLSKELGVRFWVRTAPERSRVTIQVHHACTDGTGVYRFLGDLWACYGIRTAAGDKRPELGEMDSSLLRQRRRRMTDLANRTGRIPFLANGFMEICRVFGKRVAPLTTPKHPADESIAFPGIASFVLSKQLHEQLRTVAGSHGALMNDLLLAEMFRTIVRWNAEHGDTANKRYRIMMPSDLRDVEDYSMPATNMTAYTFLSRRPSECQDISQLVRSIREQTGQIKHERLGTRFADALALSEYRPEVLQWLLRRQWCIATTILSNVGDPSRRFTARFPRSKGRVVCGNVTLEHVSGVPPLRPHSHATLAIFTYRRELTISLRCNPYQFDMDDTQAFLDMYEQGLRSYLPN